MEIVAAEPPARLAIRLTFIKPFAAQDDVGFIPVPAAGGTRVTWSMDGANNFVSKLMQVSVSMDCMVGPDFEAGLASLKAIAEQP